MEKSQRDVIVRSTSGKAQSLRGEGRSPGPGRKGGVILSTQRRISPEWVACSEAGLKNRFAEKRSESLKLRGSTSSESKRN